MTNKKDAKDWLKIIAISAFLLVIIAYSAFQARKLLEGPEITLTSPLASGTTSDQLLNITGVAKNIKEISMNNRPIFIDEQGNFKERMVLMSGYNIIRIEAKDKFNKETTKTIELTYKA